MSRDDADNLPEAADDDASNLGFDWQQGNDYLHILRHGRSVTIMRGKAAARLAAKLTVANDADQQQLLARATGNYRRGNERSGRRK